MDDCNVLGFKKFFWQQLFKLMSFSSRKTYYHVPKTEYGDDAENCLSLVTGVREQKKSCIQTFFTFSI